MACTSWPCEVGRVLDETPTLLRQLPTVSATEEERSTERIRGTIRWPATIATGTWAPRPPLHQRTPLKRLSDPRERVAHLRAATGTSPGTAVRVERVEQSTDREAGGRTDRRGDALAAESNAPERRAEGPHTPVTHAGPLGTPLSALPQCTGRVRPLPGSGIASQCRRHPRHRKHPRTGDPG